MLNSTEEFPISNHWKGIGLTLLSTACISATFIASKQAMQELSPLAFSPLWFAVASVWGIGLYLWESGFTWPKSLRPYFGPILLMGFLNGLANLLLFFAINLGDPTVAAFFSRSVTVYSVLLGVFVLSERLSQRQWVGVILTIIGAGVMTFRSGEVVLMMLAILLVSNFLLALSWMIAKQYIQAVPSVVLSTARTLIMTIMLGGISLTAGELAWPTPITWVWVIGGAFLGPFISYIFFYRSLIHLELSKAEVIRASSPLFVAIYGLLLFGTIMTFQQFIGGFILLGGIVLMLYDT